MNRRDVVKASVASAVSVAMYPTWARMGRGAVSGGGGTLQITTASLPNATVGSSYSQTISVTGGSGSGYSVYVQQATPNSGLWLQPTGPTTLGGIPQAEETSQITLVACDDAGNVSAPVTLNLTSSATGALAFVTPATLETPSSGGIFCRPIIMQGGAPPYIHSSADQQQPWAINWDGWVLGTPTITGAVSITDVVTDSAGNSVSRTFTATTGSGIGLAGLDLSTNQINLPKGMVGKSFTYSFWPFGGTGTGYSCSVIAGALSPGLSISTLTLSGTPTRAGTFFATVRVTDGTNTQSFTVCQQVMVADTATRPAYNTGTGYFVANGKLYDANGKYVQLRGLDRNHYDSASWASGANGAKTNARIARVFEFDGRTAAQAASDCTTEYLNNGIVPVLTVNTVGGTGTSGSSSTTLLATAMADWLSYYSSLASLDNQILYNIANEWGPGSGAIAWMYAYQYVASGITAISGATVTINSSASTNPFANAPFALIKSAGGITDVVLNVSSVGGSQGAWTVTFSASPVGTYTSGGTLYGGAVGVMRGAGYKAPIVIDAGGAGQDWSGLIANAQAIQQSDPQQNCVFSYHAYGSVTNEECEIASVATGSTTVVTLNSSLPYHPMLPPYTSFSTNTFEGDASYVISGAQGMTQLNGSQPCSKNNVGGSQGAWTVTLSVNSTGWPAYTGGGRIVRPRDYRQVLPQLSALRANNVCVMVLEFGPGNQFGNHLIAFNGYISGTTLTVTSMISGQIPTDAMATTGIYTSMMITSANGASPTIAYGTGIPSQVSGTIGGVGVYNVSISQTIGSSGTPVPMFLQCVYGSASVLYGPATGPSPTDVSIGQLVSQLEAQLMPWAYWALDDHNIGLNQECSWLGWFGIENKNTAWSVPSDLNVAGMDIVFNPRYGLRTLAA